MQQIDFQIEQPNCFEHSSAEEDKPLAVVAVVLSAAAVEMIAIKVLGLLDEIGGHIAAGNSRFEEPPGDRLSADRDRQFHANRLERKTPFEHLAIGGHDQRRLVPELRQRCGQGAANIRQTARLGEWNGLAGCQQNLHVEGSLIVSTTGLTVAG